MRLLHHYELLLFLVHVMKWYVLINLQFSTPQILYNFLLTVSSHNRMPNIKINWYFIDFYLI
jgi:hypothetical protein